MSHGDRGSVWEEGEGFHGGWGGCTLRGMRLNARLCFREKVKLANLCSYSATQENARCVRSRQQEESSPLILFGLKAVTAGIGPALLGPKFKGAEGLMGLPVGQEQ